MKTISRFLAATVTSLYFSLAVAFPGQPTPPPPPHEHDHDHGGSEGHGAPDIPAAPTTPASPVAPPSPPSPGVPATPATPALNTHPESHEMTVHQTKPSDPGSKLAPAAKASALLPAGASCKNNNVCGSMKCSIPAGELAGICK